MKLYKAVLGRIVVPNEDEFGHASGIAKAFSTVECGAFFIANWNNPCSPRFSLHEIKEGDDVAEVYAENVDSPLLVFGHATSFIDFNPFDHHSTQKPVDLYAEDFVLGDKSEIVLVREIVVELAKMSYALKGPSNDSFRSKKWNEQAKRYDKVCELLLGT